MMEKRPKIWKRNKIKLRGKKIVESREKAKKIKKKLVKNKGIKQQKMRKKLRKKNG